jgi:ATP-dependent DNA helicase RecG
VIARCQQAGLPAPEFRQEGGQFIQTLGRPAPQVASQEAQVTPPVTPPVGKLLEAIADRGELGNAVIRNLLGLTDRTHVRKHYVDVALAGGFIEPTIPDKPTSRLQKYRLTDKARAWLASQKSKGGPP